MAKWQRLTLQQVLNGIFIDTLSENDEEDHLEEDCNDSAECLPELDEAVPNEVTDTCNEPVRSTENKCFSFHWTSRAGLRGACGRIPANFALLLYHYLSTTIKWRKRIFIFRLFRKVSLKSIHECRKYQPFAEPTVRSTWKLLGHREIPLL